MNAPAFPSGQGMGNLPGGAVEWETFQGLHRRASTGETQDRPRSAGALEAARNLREVSRPAQSGSVLSSVTSRLKSRASAAPQNPQGA